MPVILGLLGSRVHRVDRFGVGQPPGVGGVQRGQWYDDFVTMIL
jgi:hypothetical protein